MLTNCGDAKQTSVNTDNHIEVAKVAYSARWHADLERYKPVSTDAAYSVFETETNLLSRKKDDNTPDYKEVVVRADSVINDIAWVSLKFVGQDVNATLKLVKTDSGWKHDIFDPNKDRSPLKKETITFPKLK